MKNTSLLKNMKDSLGLTILYRIIGFVREMIVASYLGTTTTADAFSIAYSLPNLIVELLALGTISAASIPVFQDVLQEEGEGRLQTLYNRMNTATMFFLLIIIGVCELSTPFLAKALAPSFSAEKLSLTSSMMKKMLPAILFIGLLGIQTSVMHMSKNYVTTGVSHLVHNCILALGALLAMMLDNLEILICSFTISAIGQWLIQLRGARKAGMRPRIDFSWKDENIKQIILLMLPIMLGSLAVHLSPVAARAIASSLSDGTVAAIGYSYKLIMLPVGVVGGSILSAVFPRISRSVSDRVKLASLSRDTFRLLLVLLLPITAIMMAFSIPIVNILYERGAFTWQDTIETAEILTWYAPCIMTLGITQMMNNNFYALKRVREPVISSIASMILSVLLATTMSKGIGSKAIPLGFSIGSFLNILYLGSRSKTIAKNMLFLKAKEILFCVVSFICVFAFVYVAGHIYSNAFIEAGTLVRLLYCAVSCAFALAIYFVVLFLTNALTIKNIIQNMKAKD